MKIADTILWMILLALLALMSIAVAYMLISEIRDDIERRKK